MAALSVVGHCAFQTDIHPKLIKLDSRAGPALGWTEGLVKHLYSTYSISLELQFGDDGQTFGSLEPASAANENKTTTDSNNFWTYRSSLLMHPSIRLINEILPVCSVKTIAEQ